MKGNEKMSKEQKKELFKAIDECIGCDYNPEYLDPDELLTPEQSKLFYEFTDEGAELFYEAVANFFEMNPEIYKEYIKEAKEYFCVEFRDEGEDEIKELFPEPYKILKKYNFLTF